MEERRMNNNSTSSVGSVVWFLISIFLFRVEKEEEEKMVNLKTFVTGRMSCPMVSNLKTNLLIFFYKR